MRRAPAAIAAAPVGGENILVSARMFSSTQRTILSLMWVVAVVHSCK